ncbi:MAG: N-acetylmuramic acid 6-phosphate etherase [FCB group bacterium]|nr:N-acetylmuramic acid 6-phosphate etherase [FCB group bacterium]
MPLVEKITERRNKKSADIDSKSIRDILELINAEDATVAGAVEGAIPRIEDFVRLTVKALSSDGRLFYVGSGTSGRLGVLDAAECPPTFSVEPTLVQGIIAGGEKALVQSVENAEDSLAEGKASVEKAAVTPQDVVLGISTSSATPYVLAALERAAEMGASTGLLICNEMAKPAYIDVLIPVIVGPEIITGSTRMKAGTATKLVLNMISTTTMIKLNKTYGNLMVDLKALNQKLWDRGTRIIREFVPLDYESARELLISAKGEVKTAIVMACCSQDYASAKTSLEQCGGSLRKVIG